MDTCFWNKIKILRSIYYIYNFIQIYITQYKSKNNIIILHNKLFTAAFVVLF